MLSQTGDSLTADEVVEAVLEEFAAAEKALDIKLRLILCCIRGITGNSSPCPPPPTVLSYELSSESRSV